MTDATHLLTWEELCADKSLEDMPYRIELNGWNQIVMSPTNPRHSRCMSQISCLLNELLPDGQACFAAAVQTSDNVKVPDVTWSNGEFFRQHMDACALPSAPEICVEVLTAANRTAEIAHKRVLYLEAGAREVWICGLMGEMEFYSPDGPLARSALCPEFPARVEI